MTELDCHRSALYTPGSLVLRMDPPCDDIPDFELIRRMADQTADFSMARAAWGRFYIRHQAYVLGVCSARFGCLLRLDEVTDLVQDGFMRAFERAATFNCSEACDEHVQRRKCRAWLVTIVVNMIRDRFRDHPEVTLVPLDPERVGTEGEDLTRNRTADRPDAIQVAVNPDPVGQWDTADRGSSEGEVPRSDRLRLLKSGFALLTVTEQMILYATTSWWQPDRENQRMPHEALQRLSGEIGKSPENIRQIRSRAIKKLTKYVNDGLNNEKID